MFSIKLFCLIFHGKLFVIVYQHILYYNFPSLSKINYHFISQVIMVLFSFVCISILGNQIIVTSMNILMDMFFILNCFL